MSDFKVADRTGSAPKCNSFLAYPPGELNKEAGS